MPVNHSPNAQNEQIENTDVRPPSLPSSMDGPVDTWTRSGRVVRSQNNHHQPNRRRRDNNIREANLNISWPTHAPLNYNVQPPQGRNVLQDTYASRGAPPVTAINYDLQDVAGSLDYQRHRSPDMGNNRNEPLSMAPSVQPSRFEPAFNQYPPVSYYAPIDLTPYPQFGGKSEENPLDFLDSLEMCFVQRNLPDHGKLSIFRSCLTDDAKLWLLVVPSCQNYGQIKDAFLQQFWGPDVQGEIKMEIASGRYRPTAGLSMSSYFLKLFQKSQNLTPSMSWEEFSRQIIYHFPIGIARDLVAAQTRNAQEFLRIINFFERIENRRGFSSLPSERGNSNVNETSRKPNRFGGPSIRDPKTNIIESELPDEVDNSGN